MNSRVVIRRKKSDQVLTQVFINNVLSAQQPTKFVIEVANSKYFFRLKKGINTKKNLFEFFLQVEQLVCFRRMTK